MKSMLPNNLVCSTARNGIHCRTRGRFMVLGLLSILSKHAEGVMLQMASPFSAFLHTDQYPLMHRCAKFLSPFRLSGNVGCRVHAI